MNNLSFLFGAFALVSLVFFIHSWVMSSRQKRLEKKLEELKSHLKDRT
jgi:CcmD family protein